MFATATLSKKKDFGYFNGDEQFDSLDSDEEALSVIKPKIFQTLPKSQNNQDNGIQGNFLGNNSGSNARIAAIALAAQVSEKDSLRMAKKRGQLLAKKAKKGLTFAEKNELALLSWEISSIRLGEFQKCKQKVLDLIEFQEELQKEMENFNQMVRKGPNYF